MAFPAFRRSVMFTSSIHTALTLGWLECQGGPLLPDGHTSIEQVCFSVVYSNPVHLSYVPLFNRRNWPQSINNDRPCTPWVQFFPRYGQISPRDDTRKAPRARGCQSL